MKLFRDKNFLIPLFVLIFLASGLVLISRSLKRDEKQNPNPKNVTIPEKTNPPNPISPTVETKYHYPISDYNNRIKVKSFGQYFTSSNNPPTCGRAFVGYHDGDDLEVTETELNSDVPVYAVADGRIRQVSTLSGYGGLLIMEANLNGQEVTMNYGHISLASTKVKTGDEVKVGQELALLGKGCSAETDGERKHLHFAIHKGSTIDVAGYIKTQAELTNWLNPKEELAAIGAK
jgi:murein DD-endopeptidase MepM/ murein hydrolase activator NlpD